jgi:hypothetical protein
MRTTTILLFLFAFVPAGVAGSPASPARTAPAGIAPFAPSICNTSDLVTLLGKNGALQSNSQKAVLLIQARIAACKRAINQYIDGLSQSPIIARNPPGLPPLPTPSPVTTPPRDCKAGSDTSGADPIQLYSALTSCVSWIANNVPSPAASTPTPQPIGFHTPTPGSTDTWSKAVYVLALASDQLVSAQVALQLANYIRAPGINPNIHVGENPLPVPDIYSDRLVRYHVIAEPGWTLERYQQQCFMDPSTAGAIVALQPGAVDKVFSLLVNVSQTNVNMQLMVLDCEPTNTAYVNNAAYIMYVSHVRNTQAIRRSVSLATLLGALAIYFGFTPSTTSTYAIRPLEPVPRGTPHKTGYQVTTNANVGPAVVGAAGLTSFNALGEQPSSAAQTATAISRLLPDLIDDLMWQCSNQIRPGDSSFRQPQCDWFTYRTPVGPRKP